MLRLLRNASSHRLHELDLQDNFINFGTCRDLTTAALANGVKIWLQGNRVLDEVFNAVTHGIGELLVICGCFLMGGSLRGKPEYVKRATIIYLISLNVLYLC